MQSINEDYIRLKITWCWLPKDLKNVVDRSKDAALRKLLLASALTMIMKLNKDKLSNVFLKIHLMLVKGLQ